MDYSKVSQKINDIVGDNVAKLAQLFPSAVKDGEVDFEALKNELGEFEEVCGEKYELTWAGKKNAKKIAQEDVVGKTLNYIEEDSKKPETTENLYIEGDNLEVLKLLRQNYYGAIEVIYIDPPYNTGNDFVYNDSFVMNKEEADFAEGNIDELGERFVINSNAGNRYHANWMNMMYPRLKVAKDLLSDKGVIFVSIDNNEIDNLRLICDEVFGESCFVNCVSWQKTYSPKNNSKGIPDEVEHIMIYSKLPDWQPKRLPRTEEMNAKYSNPDNDVAPWMSSDAFAPGAVSHQGMVYAIQNPFNGKLIYPYVGGCWRYEQSQILDIMNGWTEYHLEDIHDDKERARVCGISRDVVRKEVKSIMLTKSVEEAKKDAMNVLQRGQWPRFYFTKNGNGGIRRKTYLDNLDGKLPTNFWSYEEVGHSDEAKKELKNLFEGDAPFDTPKPVRLIERMLTIASNEDATILDFFSGSATVAHAVMRKNAEDKGGRKYILVQLPEISKSPAYSTLCEIGKERIRRAGDKILSENPETDIDIGFKVFRVAETNIKWNSLVDAGQLDMTQLETTPDQVDFIPNAKDVDIVYELMLRQKDVPLSSKIERIFGGGVQAYLPLCG